MKTSPRLSLVALSALTILGSALAFVSILQANADDQTAPEKSVHEKIVDTMTVLADGAPAGFRTNHAKGIVLTSSSTPSNGHANAQQGRAFPTNCAGDLALFEPNRFADVAGRIAKCQPARDCDPLSNIG